MPGKIVVGLLRGGVLAVCLLSVLGAAPPPDEPPELSPLPTAVPQPDDNPTTEAKVALGRLLFFDPRLSGGNDVSCATCHDPARGWADGLAGSPAIGGGKLARNSQSVLNVGFLESLFWDGRAESLEAQALLPIQSPLEMNQDLDDLVRELAAIPGYVEPFQQAFGGPPTSERVAQALAAFERTIVGGQSPLDRYLTGEEDALSDEARRGLELFTGAAGCVRCHRGPLMSDGQYYRLGVGRGDEGRGAITGRGEDRFKFRTPPLRDVARTAPYMHDGSRKTLTDVVEFYLRGASTRGVDGLPLDIEPLLGQSYADVAALVAFLESLTSDLPDVEPPELPE